MFQAKIDLNKNPYASFLLLILRSISDNVAGLRRPWTLRRRPGLSATPLRPGQAGRGALRSMDVGAHSS